MAPTIDIGKHFEKENTENRIASKAVENYLDKFLKEI